MWIAARPKLPPSSALYTKNALPVKAVINLDGLADPVAFHPMESKVCALPAMTRFFGGSLVRGLKDQIAAYEGAARAKGDVVTITALDGAGHFDMLAPRSPHWKTVEPRFHALLR